MNIAFHATAPFPKITSTDAVFQEIGELQSNFGGAINTLYPLGHGTYLPWRLFGLHQVPKLWRWDQRFALHHVFSSHLWPFPVMRLWRKPVIYTLVAGLAEGKVHSEGFPPHTQIIVSNERDAALIRQRSQLHPTVIRPAIAGEHFQFQAVPDLPFTILAGSAPWGSEQFVSKGIEALLTIAAQIPDLRLILLWRDVLFEKINARVAELGLTQRVEIINQRVDVNALLARCHATIVLAQQAQLVKAWPHSLIESLLAGKPVIVSQAIPMADYVKQHQCGMVVETLTPPMVKAAIQELRQHYLTYQTKARQIPREDFATSRLIRQYGAIYQAALSQAR